MLKPYPPLTISPSPHGIISGAKIDMWLEASGGACDFSKTPFPPHCPVPIGLGSSPLTPFKTSFDQSKQVPGWGDPSKRGLHDSLRTPPTILHQPTGLSTL